MLANFAPIGQLQDSRSGDNSFWPSFTDIMMVITMIFLMATSLLVVRNWQLVAELRESIVAEQLAEQLIESTFLENVTLEERLANAEQSNSILRLRILKKDEELLIASNTIQQQAANIAALEASNTEFGKSLDQSSAALARANIEIEKVDSMSCSASCSATMLSRNSATSCQLRTTNRLVAIRKIIVMTIMMSVNDGQKLLSPLRLSCS